MAMIGNYNSIAQAERARVATPTPTVKLALASGRWRVDGCTLRPAFGVLVSRAKAKQSRSPHAPGAPREKEASAREGARRASSRRARHTKKGGRESERERKTETEKQRDRERDRERERERESESETARQRDRERVERTSDGTMIPATVDAANRMTPPSCQSWIVTACAAAATPVSSSRCVCARAIGGDDTAFASFGGEPSIFRTTTFHFILARPPYAPGVVRNVPCA